MVFEYAPEEDALSEAFWTFTIPSQSLSAPFLLVGAVSEPRVCFDRPSLGFGRVQLGVRAKLAFSIVNDEARAFQFALSKASYAAAPELLAAGPAAGGRAVLEFSPDAGTVPAGGKARRPSGAGGAGFEDSSGASRGPGGLGPLPPPTNVHADTSPGRTFATLAPHDPAAPPSRAGRHRRGVLPAA
jgi:hypothetical protein